MFNRRHHPQITVMPHIAGSKCVVQLGSSEHYIDARQDVRCPNVSFIEVVIGGKVCYRETCHDGRAPARIIELIKERLQ